MNMTMQEVNTMHQAATIDMDDFDVSKVEVAPYDVVDYLRDEDDIRGYLEAVAEFDEPELMVAATKDAVRARSVNRIVQATGLDRKIVCTFFAPVRDDAQSPVSTESVITPEHVKMIARAAMLAAA